MSIVTLSPVRRYDGTTPYHYTFDNQPIDDLAANQATIATALNALSTSVNTQVVAGNWATPLQVVLDLSQDLGHAFAYRIKFWAIQDQSVLAGHSATLVEDVVMGYNALPGTVNLTATTNILRQQTGTAILSQSYTASGNNLVISFSGYTGTQGYVAVKLERYGF